MEITANSSNFVPQTQFLGERWQGHSIIRIISSKLTVVVANSIEVARMLVNSDENGMLEGGCLDV